MNTDVNSVPKFVYHPSTTNASKSPADVRSRSKLPPLSELLSSINKQTPITREVVPAKVPYDYKPVFYTTSTPFSGKTSPPTPPLNTAPTPPPMVTDPSPVMVSRPTTVQPTMSPNPVSVLLPAAQYPRLAPTSRPVSPPEANNFSSADCYQLAQLMAFKHQMTPVALRQLVLSAHADINQFYHYLCDMTKSARCQGLESSSAVPGVWYLTSLLMTNQVLLYYFSLYQACTEIGIEPPVIPLGGQPRLFAVFSADQLDLMAMVPATKKEAKRLSLDKRIAPISWQAILEKLSDMQSAHVAGALVSNIPAQIAANAISVQAQVPALTALEVDSEDDHTVASDCKRPHEPRTRSFACPYYTTNHQCSRFGKFARLKLLRHHLRNVHTIHNARHSEIMCRECQSQFHSLASYYSHCSKCAEQRA